jgi:hypothetical protein
MRVSDLLRREPFGQILEKTLSRYWSSMAGHNVDVFWDHPSPVAWRGNPYLNFFCVDGVNPDCFDVIRREFSHSRHVLRRVPQALYVAAATRKPLRNYTSRMQFSVSEDIPFADEQLVMGGNRRIRILHPSAGRSVVIHKDGFPQTGFHREVSARQRFAAEIAPGFHGLAAEGTAFVEDYFVGTPINRLSRHRNLTLRSEACGMLTEKVHCPTLRTVGLADHVQTLCDLIRDAAPECAESAGRLALWVRELCGDSALGICQTHGDFQDANILVSESSVKIIDWESACERSQFYDLATLQSGIRLKGDKLNAWAEEVSNWLKNTKTFPDLLIPPEGKNERLGHAAVWWLEEILFLIEEDLSIPHGNGSALTCERYSRLLDEALSFLKNPL